MAIEITEIELNPAGTDYRQEWIELYSKSQINLSEYHLLNNDGDIYNLNGTFTNYITIYFNDQWLDNTDEKVFLKKSNEVIFVTPVLKDNKNTDQTWFLCNSEWLFGSSTKGRQNNCPEAEEETQEELKEPQEQDKIVINEPSEPQPDQVSDNNNNSEDQVTNNNQQVQDNTDSPIILTQSNSNDKTTNNQESQIITTKQEKTRIGIIIAFTILTVFLIILLALKKL